MIGTFILKFFVFTFVILTFLIRTPMVQAQADTPQYFTGVVLEVIEEIRVTQNTDDFYTQKVKVLRHDNNESSELQVGTEFQPLNRQQLLKKGTRLVLAEQTLADGQSEVVVVDIYRVPVLTWLFVIFCIAVIIVARWQGLFSILGMVVSLGVLVNYVIPAILAGHDPTLVSLAGCFVIAGTTIYLSHGWSLKSHLSLISILVTLLIVSFLSVTSVKVAHLVGLGSEEAYFLQFGQTSAINLQGLLLGGILLGTLGVLDDIAVSQASTVFQLKSAKPGISLKELYTRASSVGKDHVASLVNTLVLAYAGANLPLFLLFTINKTTPIWTTLNNEIISEEIIRTFVGSLGLIIAVPLTTALTAFVVHRYGDKKMLRNEISSSKVHHHQH